MTTTTEATKKPSVNIPNVKGSIFRLGDEVFLANGDKTYSVVGAYDVYSRKDLRKLAKDGNITPVFYLELAEGIDITDAKFCMTTNTPHAWSSGPEIRMSREFVDEKGMRRWGDFESLEQARKASLDKQKHTFTESHVNTQYGILFNNPRSAYNTLR